MNPTRFTRRAKWAAALGLLLLAGVAYAAPIPSRRGALRAGVEATARAADPNDAKLDPALRMMVSGWNEARRLGASAAGGDALGRLLDPTRAFHLRHDADAGEPVASTFVKLASPEAASVIEAAGARVVARVGDVVAARVPISRVMSLAGRPEVLCLQMAGTSSAFLDSSRTRSRAGLVHAGTGLDRPYQGSGVIVGVFDTGLDYTHLDFKTAGGATRLKGLYDFSFGANGREWSIGSIDSATSTEYDGRLGNGHGTHVTGTAAGGGMRNAVYRGIAPLADIVFVKGMRDTASGGGFNEADIVAGAQFIFDKARSLGQPCVVNLSLGGQFGPHDGTSLYEQAIDGLTHPGSIVVVAAGNAAQAYVHAGYSVPPGTTYDESNETAWNVFSGATQSIVDAWYPATGSIRFGVAVYSPGDLNNPLAGTATVPPGANISSQTVTDGITNYGRITIDATTTADPNNGKRRVFFSLTNSPGYPPASSYVWSIYAVGAGTFDMWVASGGAFPPESFFGTLPSWFVPGDNAKSIAIPATAKKVISVGSYVTKTQWVDLNGVTRTQPSATLDAISGFSSRGPSADGRSLPDLVAPGEVIVAPLPYTVEGFMSSTDIAFGGGYRKAQGTSMASPHVAGAVALMLEKNRFLTPENARQLLRSSAAPPPIPDPNRWGAGKLDARAAMLATPDPVPCGGPVPFGARPVDCPEERTIEPGTLVAQPNPAATAATLSFRLGAPEHVDLAVYDLAGRRIRTLRSEPMPSGPHESVWDGTRDDGSRVRAGIYFARLRTPSQTALQRLVMVP